MAKVYQNAGNDLILSMVPGDARRVLDVGCGAGDNCRRLMELRSDRMIVGITHSASEAAIARQHCADVLVADLEAGPPAGLDGLFDAMIFSHVLEHLVDPSRLLDRLMPYLAPGGAIIIAVPNVLEWRTRARFLRGDFAYADDGVLDRTHLRFYTYRTVVRELMGPVPELRIDRLETRGSFPLGPLRRSSLPDRWKRGVDRFAVRRWPNLFASEIGIVARKIPEVVR